MNKTFRLHDETQPRKYYGQYYCDVTVTIVHKKYKDNTEFYDIQYDFSYSSKDHDYINPLKENDRDGVIIAVNELSDVLVKYLLMDIEELEKYSGSVTGECYKKTIMNTINSFWD
tara:strand:+ start:11404 stop:11748 length:345 start_codon:yes stop_codon:yes gene_type:complete